MNYDDLTDEQKEIWDESAEKAWDAGWEEGYQACLDEGDSGSDLYDDGYHAGYLAGQEAEQKRIQFVLQMMFDSALNMGQGNKAVQYKHAMDLLRPVEIKNLPEDDF